MTDNTHRKREVDSECGDQKHEDHSRSEGEVLPEDFFRVARDAQEDRDV